MNTKFFNNSTALKGGVSTPLRMKKNAVLYLFFISLLLAQKSEVPPVTSVAITEEDAPELDIEALLRTRITLFAQEHLGVPYKYAGISPEGFDCSGFVYFVYREAAGMDVSRSSVGIWNSGKKITLDQVRPGDVLVFTTVRAGASHTGIVLENGPRGIIFIHSASQGSQTGVIISNMNESYYKTRFMGARSYF